MRKIEFELNDLLGLLLCSEYYEFNNDILYHSIAERIETLSDEEIESYLIANNKSEEGEEYNQDEINRIREYFKSVREEYLDIK